MAEFFIIHKDAPRKTAMTFKEKIFPTLINSQDEWLSWDGAAYQPLEAATVESRVSSWLAGCRTRSAAGKPVIFHPKKSHITEVLKALKNLCHVPADTMSPPTWLDGRPKLYRPLHAANLISFQNCLLDISTFKTYPQTEFFFTRAALDIDYDAEAPEPELWLSFLNETLQGNAALITLLQQWLGYMLSSDTSQQRIMFLWGRPGSGKGTILRVMTALVGQRNTVAHTIGYLGGTFGRQGLIGKSSLTVTDMATGDLKVLSNAATILNGISGEDYQTIPRKNTSDWNGFLPTRATLGGNGLPNFREQTSAMARRLMIIPFKVSFEDCADPGLGDKLMRELPAILNWALSGLVHLRLEEGFAEPAASKVAKLRLIYASDPIHGFVEERCTLDPLAVTSKDDVFVEMVAYCKEVGAHCPAKATFSERLMAAYPAVGETKLPRDASGHRAPAYRGLRLQPQAAADFAAGSGQPESGPRGPGITSVPIR